MKIDLHVHSREYSSCGQDSAEEMVEAAIAHGLDGLVFTNHWRYVRGDHMVALNACYAPFRVFNGVETNVCGEDFVVVGPVEGVLTREDWEYGKFHEYVRSREGFLILPHPYRYHDNYEVDLAQWPPDALECRSCNITPDHYPAIEQLAARLLRPLICASDAHCVANVGLACVELAASPTTEAELAAALRAGRFKMAGGAPLGSNSSD